MYYARVESGEAGVHQAYVDASRRFARPTGALQPASVRGRSLRMSDGAGGDSTVQDIVVALRDTARRRGGGTPPRGEALSGGGHDDDPGRSERVDSLHRAWRGDSAADTDITELRDAEIQRLLGENRRLNDRVLFLLKVIEHDQQMLADERAAAALLAQQQETVARDTRAALEAEWRPILVTLLRMLDRRGHEPSQDGGGVQRYFGGRRSETRAGGRTGRDDGDERGYDPNWILDLIRGADRSDRASTTRDHGIGHEAGALSDEREGRFFVRFFTRITHFR